MMRDRIQPSATRRPAGRGTRRGYGWNSPLLRRAQPSSRGPAEMLPLLPSAPFQSSDSVRGDRPPSTVAMITGQASRVDSNRARILLDGISRSEYPTAPSMQISVFSPGAFANRFGRVPFEKSNSGISRSASSAGVFIAFWLRGAVQPSATRRPVVRGVLFEYGRGSALLWRAHRSSRGPAEMLTDLPSASIASRERVRGERPPSTVAMITGQASRVPSKRARILLEGISLSEYPTAPSMKISVFSPGLRAYRPTSASFQSRPLTSGMKNSSSGLSFVRMSFALRGAPCGDDSRPRTAFRRYHNEQESLLRSSDKDETSVARYMTPVWPSPMQRIVFDGAGLIEGDPVLEEVFHRLVHVPVVLPRHRRTVATGPYLAVTR